MRVIAGICRGRKLNTPADDAVRPTTDKVKEALFSSLQFELEGAYVLDLFAGSGQLGIEALSRGAAAAVMCDCSKVSIQLIKSNLAACGLHAEVLQTDSLKYLAQCDKRFDIALLDPPYATGLLQKALPAVSRVMHENGVIVAECPYGEAVPETLENGFAEVKNKKYGSMCLHYYRKG